VIYQILLLHVDPNMIWFAGLGDFCGVDHVCISFQRLQFFDSNLSPHALCVVAKRAQKLSQHV
jgi:hypothetical protein